ncbi:MAG: AHH domain-containing protein [Pseudomonadota bacterium]
MRHLVLTAKPIFQHHHLLPLSLIKRRQIGIYLARMEQFGIRLTDRATNCQWLPANEATAFAVGHAMHRGPHPRYTDVVAHRVERIRQRGEDNAAAVARLRRLQRAMARLLTGVGPRNMQLNRRDPMRCFADYSYLDDALTRMFSAAE